MEQQIGIRLPDVVLARLDRAVATARQDQPGLNLTRSDLVRQFLLEGLQRAEARAGVEVPSAEEPARAA